MDVLNRFLQTVMFGSVFGMVIWSATGLLGGLTMALIVKLLRRSFSSNGLWVIIIGWFIGIVVGFSIGYIALAFVESNFLSFVVILISGLIAGGIGSRVMYGVIDREVAG